MANTAFDFLTESFLFYDSYIDENFRTVPEEELLAELQKYREHIQKSFADIVHEVQNNNELNVSIESAGELPNEQLLKQLALYLDKVVIADPIFELTTIKSDMHVPMSKLMGINPNCEIDRSVLAYSAKYMKWSTPLVAAQFVKYVPISLMHEPPKDIPILYSRDNFSSELSEELYSFFYGKAVVSNVIREDGTMRYSEGKKLEPGTTIAINFDREHIRKSRIYQFLQSKFKNLDEKTGKFKMMQYMPDKISESDFQAWVHQSINRAAIGEFHTTLNEAILAKKLKCMYMAKSQFTSELLSQTIAKKSVDADLSNLSMNLELPVTNGISIGDLISIRLDNGEAFHNFRRELSSKLSGLRGLTDQDDLQIALENISYEMNETQVSEVKKEYRKIARSLGVDVAMLTGSLVTSFFTGGLTLIGAAGAIAKGSADYVKYLNDVKENNGYFLWKLNRIMKQ